MAMSFRVGAGGGRGAGGELKNRAYTHRHTRGRRRRGRRGLLPAGLDIGIDMEEPSVRLRLKLVESSALGDRQASLRGLGWGHLWKPVAERLVECRVRVVALARLCQDRDDTSSSLMLAESHCQVASAYDVLGLHEQVRGGD